MLPVPGTHVVKRYSRAQFVAASIYRMTIVMPAPHSEAESGGFNSLLTLWLGDVPYSCLILLEHNRVEVGKQLI